VVVVVVTATAFQMSFPLAFVQTSFFDEDPLVSPAFEHEPPALAANAFCNGKLNAKDAISATLETTLGIIFIATI
jgi:hypothetical protein